MINCDTKENKNIINELLIALLISLVVFIPLFKKGIYRGEDLQFHLSRFDGIIQSIKDGQLPLAIYPYKNYGFGYASPLFYCDLFLTIPAITRYIFNINIVSMYKIVIFVCVYFTSFSILHFSLKLSNNLQSSLLATCLFMFSNYYLTDMYARMALGEIMAMTFIPTLIYNMYELIYEDKDNWIKLGLLFDCVLFCHNISFVLVIVLFGILLVINVKKIFNLKKIATILKASILAVGLALFFLLPMLEQIYLQDLAMNHSIYNTMQDDALTLKTLFSDICFQFGFDFGNTNGITLMDQKAIGILIIGLPLFGFVNFKNKDRFIKQILILGYVFILCTTRLIPLYKLSYINFIQYPSRLCLIALPLLSFSVSVSYKDFKYIKSMLVITTLLLLINTSFLYVALIKGENIVIIDENTTINELFIDRKYAKEKNLGAPTNREELMNGEYLPYQSHIYDYQNSSRDITYGGNFVAEYIREGTKLRFSIDYPIDTRVYIPLTWYPGYYACELKNGECIKDVELVSDWATNRIAFRFEAGNREYLLNYKGTKIQKYSMYVSILTFIIFIVYISIKYIRNHTLRISHK